MNKQNKIEQPHSYRELTDGCQRGEDGGMDEIGEGIIQSSIYKIRHENIMYKIENIVNSQ